MKKLFQASFEESLNLRDDSVSNGFIERNLAETEEKEKYRGTLKSYIWLTLLTLFFIFGPNWLFYKASYYIYSHFDSSFLKQSTYNFLPYWLFLLLGCTWLFLIIIGKRFSQKFILIYRGQFHLFVTYFLWLLIEWNLFCLTGFSASLGLFGTLSFLAINFYFIYIIFRNRIRNLLNLMLIKDEKYKSDSSDKEKRMLLIIGIIFILWLVGKFFFTIQLDASLGIIASLLMWFLINIIFAVGESALILPFMLRGYYLLKYPEEYREWEGKSLEEWYGEKYLKKRSFNLPK